MLLSHGIQARTRDSNIRRRRGVRVLGIIHPDRVTVRSRASGCSGERRNIHSVRVAAARSRRTLMRGNANRMAVARTRPRCPRMRWNVNRVRVGRWIRLDRHPDVVVVRDRADVVGRSRTGRPGVVFGLGLTERVVDGHVSVAGVLLVRVNF